MVNEEQQLVVPQAPQTWEPEPEPQLVVCVGEVDDLSGRIITAHRGGKVEQIATVGVPVSVVILPPGMQITGPNPRLKQGPNCRNLWFASGAWLVLNHEISVTQSWIHAPYPYEEDEINYILTLATDSGNETGTDAP